MRHLNRPRADRGLTLIELMVALSIAAILAMAAAPSFVDYIANSRLRENGNALYTQALFAQSEAIKRNTIIRLSTAGSTIQIIDRTDPNNPAVLFERQLTDGIAMTAATVDFNGEGRTVGFAAGAVNLSSSSATCSSEIRCPGLRIDGGGGMRLCSDHNSNCS